MNCCQPWTSNCLRHEMLFEVNRCVLQDSFRFVLVLLIISTSKVCREYLFMCDYDSSSYNSKDFYTSEPLPPWFFLHSLIDPPLFHSIQPPPLYDHLIHTVPPHIIPLTISCVFFYNLYILIPTPLPEILVCQPLPLLNQHSFIDFIVFYLPIYLNLFYQFIL